MFEAWLNSMIASYGQFGLLIVMVVQTIIAPIPSEALLVFAGAIGISLLNVTVFGGLGLIIGAAIAFLLARYGGRHIVEKLLGRKWTVAIDTWVTENGARAILFTRLIPFIPFDLISYMSGITSLSFRSYMIATVIGAFPRCLMLAALGGIAGQFLILLGFGIDLITVAGIAGFILLAYLDRKGHIDILEKGITGRVVKKVFKNNPKADVRDTQKA